jgi:hypothetical protein
MNKRQGAVPDPNGNRAQRRAAGQYGRENQTATSSRPGDTYRVLVYNVVGGVPGRVVQSFELAAMNWHDVEEKANFYVNEQWPDIVEAGFKLRVVNQSMIERNRR